MPAFIVVGAERKPIACSSTYGDDGIKKRVFIKDAIFDGKYKKNSGSENWELDVNADRMKKWSDTFALMRERGVDVPLVKDHIVSVDTTMGYVTDMFRDEDGTLKAVLEARGEENIDKLLTVDRVSVYIEPAFNDGKGNTYDEAITHIAVTPVPVVPNQSGCISIAASRSQQPMEVPVYSLAATGDRTMTREWMKKLSERAKLKAAEKEEEVYQGVMDYLDGIEKERDEHKSAAEKKATELKAASEKVVELEKGKKPELDEEMAEERTADVASDLDAMVKESLITPALAASLRTELCGTGSARNTYMLSRSSNEVDGVKPVRARRFLGLMRDALKNNAPKPGSKTGAQSLSRDSDDNKDREAMQNRMLSRAGIGDNKPVL